MRLGLFEGSPFSWTIISDYTSVYTLVSHIFILGFRKRTCHSHHYGIEIKNELGLRWFYWQKMFILVEPLVSGLGLCQSYCF